MGQVTNKPKISVAEHEELHTEAMPTQGWMDLPRLTEKPPPGTSPVSTAQGKRDHTSDHLVQPINDATHSSQLLGRVVTWPHKNKEARNHMPGKKEALHIQ